MSHDTSSGQRPPSSIRIPHPHQRTILFVGGCARSGTTAFVDLLSSHRDVLVSHERWINTVRAAHAAGAPMPIGAEHFQGARFLKPVPEETQAYQWGQNPERLRAMTLKFARAQVIGDKVPEYYRHLPTLFARLPTAIGLLMLRSPLPVAASWRRYRDDPAMPEWHGGPREAVGVWNEALRMSLQIGRVFPTRLRVIDYDRLFAGDGGYLAAIMRWLGLDGVDQSQAQAFRRMTAGWSARTARPLDLSDDDRAYVERHARLDLMAEALQKLALPLALPPRKG